MSHESRNKLLWRGAAWGACLTGALFATVGFVTFEFPSPLSFELELLFPIEGALALGLLGIGLGAFFGLLVGAIIRGILAAWTLWTHPDHRQ